MEATGDQGKSQFGGVWGQTQMEGVVRRWRKLGKTTLPKGLVEKEGRKKTMYL